MKKILLFLFAAVLALTANAQTVSFDATTDLGTLADSNNAGADNVSKDGVTIAISKGLMGLGTHYRCYKNETFTVTSTIGNIKSIDITCTVAGSDKYGPGCFTVTDGTYTVEDKVGSWVGDAASVVFTASLNQVRITNVVVTVGEGGGETKAAADLKWSEDNISVEKGGEFTAPTLEKATTATVLFASDNEEVATVTSEGLIKLAGAEGKAIITASAEENDAYLAGKATCTITVYHNNYYKKVTEIESGAKYLIVAQRNDSTVYAFPLAENKSYGYLSVGTIAGSVDEIAVKSTYDDSFTITEDSGDYTIQDPYGRYLYQKDSYNSFQVGEDALVWTCEPQNDGTFKFSMNGYFIQWGTGSYKTFAVYKELGDGAVLPYLYKFDETSTGINTVKVANNGIIYNVAGQRVSENYKGIVVKNGKKYLVK